MPKAARFQVDSRLAMLLGETYRSTEQALKELIDNAWDADATVVRVALPAPMTADPIIVDDNGTGMTEKELGSEYLFVANDRTSRRGARTPGLNRQVKGRKGIGKFAGLMVARTMTVETKARGMRTRLVLNRDELRDSQRDLESVDLALEPQPCGADEHGTKITLLHLNQNLSFPSPDKLKALLMLEYGRHPQFTLYVNDEEVDLADIPGETFEHKAALDEVGPVSLRYTISDGKKPLKESGIVVRIAGKSVGKPTYFGLEDDELMPPKLLKKVYGEVEADGLAADVTADWGVVVENSTGFAAVRTWAAHLLRAAIEEQFSREISLAKARHQLAINRALEKLPEYRRPLAQQRMERVIKKLYSMPGLSEERISTSLSVALDAIEMDDYWLVVAAIDAARDKDVKTFAEALDQFGLFDLAVIGTQTRNRLNTLDRVDELIARPETREQEVHLVFENNLWLLGADYALLASNKTLASTIERYAGQKFTGPRASKRPDLLLAEDVQGRYVLIEFKRPDHSITRDDIAQAEKYRDDLRQWFERIEIVMIGAGPAASVDVSRLAPDVRVRSFTSVVSAARTQLRWLLRQLSDPRGHVA